VRTRAAVRVAALTPYPIQGASTRFRLVQFIEPLRAFGIHMEVFPFYPATGVSGLYQAGQVLRKSGVLLSSLGHRRTLLKSLKGWDLVLVHRELTPVFPGYFVKLLRSSGVPWVFDFDDAIYLPPQGGHPILGVFRRPDQATSALIQGAAGVLAGNAFLAAFALKAKGSQGEVPSLNPEAIKVFPTVVDTALFSPGARADDRQVCPVVGWVGTHTTVSYLEPILSELADLQRELPFTLRVIGGRPPKTPPGLIMDYVPWELANEVGYFRDLDVGLYPLVEDDWTRGKCGFKAIQYLACGVAVVASPVGVIRDIVIPGRTGLWAEGPGRWREGVRLLLDDATLRRSLAGEGRKKVEREYSVTSVLPALADTLRSATGR